MIKILPENLLFSNIEKKNILDKEKPNDKEGEIFLLFKKIQKNYENILTKLNKGCYLKEIKKEQDFIENQTNNDLYFISARAESYLEIIDSAIYSVEEQCMYGIKHESFEDEAGNVISGEHIAHNWDEYTLEEKNDIYRQMYRCPPQLTTQEMAWIEYHGTWWENPKDEITGRNCFAYLSKELTGEYTAQGELICAYPRGDEGNEVEKISIDDLFDIFTDQQKVEGEHKLTPENKENNYIFSNFSDLHLRKKNRKRFQYKHGSLQCF